ncbi:MAG: hypothetical protein IPJ65_35805 [Archangiaceae bacterium]|nr:hypothetical protein [Archangiaceae bacterium]
MSGCPRPVVPAVAPAARLIAAVDPCSVDLSGWYVHATDPSWRYQGRDDGGTLELSVWRTFDGGAPAFDAGSTVSLTLWRGDGGFAGEVRALGGLPSGQTCPMSFPVRVTRCDDAGLALLAAADGVIGEGCVTPARPRNPAMLEHVLTRADAGGMRFSP